MSNKKEDTASISSNEVREGVWELPEHLLEEVSGGNDFTQTGQGGTDFAQNFSCFAQGIGDFSQGTDPDPRPKYITV